MATLNDQLDHSLVELANRMQDKRLQEILLMAADNELLGDMRFKAANGGMKHKESTFENLPVAEFGPLGGFYGSGKADARQVEEDVAHMKVYSKVPVDIAKASGNPASYRRQEDMAVVEGLTQQATEEMIYGNRNTNAFEPLGLANRLNALSLDNVHDAGGTSGNLTSVYVIKQDPRAFFGIYRQGQNAGINIRDLGEDTEVDSDTGKERQIYRTLFEWELGFMVRDPRVVHRIANIPVPSSDLDETAFAKWQHILIRVMNTIPGRNASSMRIYANSDVLTQMDIMNYTKGNANYTVQNIDGQLVNSFRNVPIRRVDAILSTESQVS